MNRRFFKSLILWIVPLLLARAMIPAGFMLSVGADGLELMFCSGSMQMPAELQQPAGVHGGHAGHAGGHDHNAGDAGQHSGHGSSHAGAQHGDAASGDSTHDNAPCPFSLAASAASVDVPYLAALALVPAGEIVPLISDPAASVGPLHIDRIRGPPLFS
jgi:hypothetical protein